MHGEDDAAQAIQKLLKVNSRGLTVSDIAKRIGINRNSTAKHLEVLAAEGRVESRMYGTAKVYSLAQRVPLSAFLCFTKNMILILDEQMNVVQANDQYLKLIGYTKQDLIGKNLLNTPLPIVSEPDALEIIQKTENEQTMADIRYRRGKDGLFFQMEVIPTTFEGGDHGLTIVLEDITERKKYVKNMEFLARTAMELVDLPTDADIFQYVAERVAELVPHPQHFWVESFDEVNRAFYLVSMLDQDFRRGCTEIVGRDVVGEIFPIQEFFFSAPFFETPSSLRDLREMHFRPYFEDEAMSLYDICMRQIPKEACEVVLKRFKGAKFYGIGLVWGEQLYGIIAIMTSPDADLMDKEVLESFVRQASIALARRQTEDRLRRSEQRFREVMELSPSPAALIGSDGRYAFVNGKFVETFGYTLEDIPNGKAWFELSFPDPGDRKKAMSAWKSDLEMAASGTAQSMTFDVRCKDGGTKTICFNPVTLGDGTQYVTYEERTAVR